MLGFRLLSFLILIIYIKEQMVIGWAKNNNILLRLKGIYV